MTTPGSIRTKPIEAPLTALQKSVDESLPFGVRKISSNGREFQSEYFLLVGNKLRKAKNARFRLYAHATILGSERPYTLEMIVYHEKFRRKSGVQKIYEKVGTNEKVAKALVKRVQKSLSKRLKEGNVIDDFRAF